MSVEKMKKIVHDPNKMTVMGYILRMQELASRANIANAHVVRYAIEGLRDRTANIAVLYMATTICALKQLALRYVQLREAYSVPMPELVCSSSDGKSKAPVGRSDAAAQANFRYNTSSINIRTLIKISTDK